MKSLLVIAAGLLLYAIVSTDAGDAAATPPGEVVVVSTPKKPKPVAPKAAPPCNCNPCTCRPGSCDCENCTCEADCKAVVPVTKPAATKASKQAASKAAPSRSAQPQSQPAYEPTRYRRVWRGSRFRGYWELVPVNPVPPQVYQTWRANVGSC